MKNAIDVVKSKQMGYTKASKWFDFPKSTLDYVKHENPLDEQCLKHFGRKPILLPEMEDLVLYLG